MISIDKSVWNILNDAENSSEFKIFLYIAVNQPEEGIFGFEVSKLQLQIDLKLSKTSIFRSIKWLKDNLLIQEIKQVEFSDFMANPRFVMNNCDFETRMNEWKRRCRLDIQREIRLERERRQRERRNSKKQ